MEQDKTIYTIRESQLNQAYMIVLKEVKGSPTWNVDGAELNINGNFVSPGLILNFRYDSTLGIKGHWICVNDNIKVLVD
jgi:hypothetical protein